MRRAGIIAAIVTVIMAGAWGGFVPVASVRAADQCFPQTEKCIGGEFYAYWLANGGLAQQGLPLSDEFSEISPTNGQSYRVQYFERARFEYHPENQPPYTVLLGLLGREQFLAKYPQGRPPTNLEGRPDYCFVETQRCVGDRFLAYWRANGGLTQQGLPISDEFDEVNPTDGKTYRTQYFERARFEYHPEQADPAYQVLLGLLGREQFLAKYPNGQPGGTAPSPAPPASPAPSASPSPVPSPTPAPTPPPSPSPSPSAPPAASYAVSASVSNSSPTQNTRVAVTGVLTNNGQGVSGATMDTVWHYKTTSPGCSGGPSGGDGRMSCTRDISTATKGYTVVIDVRITYQGQTFTTSTSFTPR